MAAPVLFGVADWLVSRVTRRRDGFDVRASMGIAERPEPSDNEAFTVLSATALLREAIDCAVRLGRPVRDEWVEVSRGLRLPRHSRTGAILSHEGFHPSETKGATPGPLAGLFPLWELQEPEVEAATLDYYLRLAPDYIGSAMLSPLYGVWAAWTGDRELAARLYEEGYARLVGERFLQTLEAIVHDLSHGSLVHRYDVKQSPDGLEGEEGTFSMCTFWLVEALTRAGRLAEARLLFEKMLGYANHVGLYAEEIGPAGEHLGNFPQAFTHLALISAAYDLDRRLSRAGYRS